MGVYARFENNLLFKAGVFGTDNVLNVLGYGSPGQDVCSEWQGFATVDALESHLTSVCASTTPGLCTGLGGTKVGGNRTLAANCAGDSGCIAWSDCAGNSIMCLQSVFAAWSSSELGLDTMFGPGWTLAPNVPCSIARSSLDLSVTNDFANTARTAPPSMGAAEHDGACTP